MTELEPWMRDQIEVKSNGYIYPARVIKKSKMGDKYMVELILPDNVGVFRMQVDKSLMMSRAHYNPIFDVAKVEKTKREEFLYPIGSKVLIGKTEAAGTITKYSPETELYCIQLTFDGHDSLFKTYLPEKEITLVDKPHTPETFAEMRKAEEEKHEVLLGDAKNEEKVKDTSETLKFTEGDRVLVMVNEYHGKKNWMPNATVIGIDNENIYQPAKGKRWFIRFDHSNLLWSYPEDRLKIDESFFDTKKEEPKAKNKYRFEVEDRVRISSYESAYAGYTGKIIGLSLDKPDYFQVKLDVDGPNIKGLNRVFPSYMLQHIQKVEDAEKPELEPEESKSEEPVKNREDEIIDLMTGFVSSMFSAAETPVDFKQFKDRVGKIREMFK